MGFLIIGIIAIIVFVRLIYNTKLNSKVEKTSLKIQALKQLNEQAQFNDINENICIYKHYDNKSNYNKIEPAYIMSAELRDNIQNYAKYIHLIKENREKVNIYNKKVEEILNEQYFVDYSIIDISEKAYIKRESKIFSRLVLSPCVDCNFEVIMTYSSPKGKVNLEKRAVFNFDAMLVSFNSISRSHLDKETYRKLSQVERGEVSDSLRYDVLNRDGFRCVICGASANEGVRLHVDHIIPIAKGGKSEISNLRTLCERCNIGKSDKIEMGFNDHQENNECPWCKGKLVLKKGKYGEFYGCANYPKCRFVKNINK